MRIDISTIPFSRYGSYFAVNFNKKLNKCYLRDIHGGDESSSELFEMAIYDDNDQSVDWNTVSFDVSETAFSVSKKNTSQVLFELIMPTSHSIYIKVTSGKVRLNAIKDRYDSFIQVSHNSYEYISYKKEMKYGFQFKKGDHSIYAPWESVGNSDVEITLMPDTVLLIENYRVVSPQIKLNSFESEKQQLVQEYNEWYESMPEVSEKYKQSKKMASYLLWSNTVKEDGLLSEDVTYMSKNWMQNIWSWDNCFNAMLLSEKHPDLAYNQMKVFIDYQDKSGAYPDFINDKYVSYNCVKPPIHAWAYKYMMKKNSLLCERTYFEPMYESLVKNTQFWLNHRVNDRTGLLVYTHGNDSGWDNASIFKEGMPVSSPDLLAHLIRQLDILAEFAEEINLTCEARMWKEKADKLYIQLLSDYLKDAQFVALNGITSEPVKSKSSGLLFIPLIIAYRLGDTLTESLVMQLTVRFEGQYGLATEELTSNLFKGNGYWLGPIWAPQTFLFVDALYHAGYKKESKRIATKFSEATLIGGMAENFNPQTGEGNDDLAFAWTSSVFLMLADESFMWEG